MKIRLFGILFGLATLLWGQDELLIRKIDSLNLEVPYEKRIETSTFNLTKYQKNLQVAQSINYEKGIADTYSNISLIYYYRSNYDISSDYFFKAIKIYESLNLNGEAGYLYAMYGYRLRHSDLKKSIEFMQKGIKMAEKANFQTGLMGIYDNYGLVKEVNKEPDSAEYFFRKSLAMKKNVNDETGIPYSLNKLGTLFLSMGKFTEAKQFFDEAYERRLKIKDAVGIAENLNFYGLYYTEVGELQQAINYYKKALDASRDVGYRWLVHKNYEELSKVYENSNQFSDALYYHKQFVAYKDSIYNLETQTNQKEIEIQFETEKKQQEILLQRAELAEQKLVLKQKNQSLYALGFLAILIGLLGFMIFRTQKLKNIQLLKENEWKDTLIKIEAQNKVNEERMRISRDLHDNIGSQLTFIICSLDNLKYQLNLENSTANSKLETLNDFTRNTITELRDTIWAMNKESISLSDLSIRINNFLDQARSAKKNMNFVVKMEDNLTEFPILTSFQGINLYRILQEAIHNSIKHSQASEVNIVFRKRNLGMEIEIRDNGIGIPEDQIGKGNGMNSMQKRISDLGGQLQVQSSPGNGTVLKMQI